MDLAELLQRYTLARPQLAVPTLDQYRYAVASLGRFLGRIPTTQDLREDTILSFLRGRLSQVAPRTVRRERGDLLTLWRWAWRKRLCEECPHDCDIPRIRVPRNPPIAWTVAEVRAVIESAGQDRANIRGTTVLKADWWRSFLFSLYWSGSRVSALLATRTRDLDVSTGLLLLDATEAKTDLGQYVRLPQQAVDAIAVIYDPTRERIWPWPYTRRQLFAAIKRIVQRAGLPADRYHAFHCFRRTAATLATANGGIEVAQAALGHASAEMTRRYIDPRFLQSSLADFLPRI